LSSRDLSLRRIKQADPGLPKVFDSKNESEGQEVLGLKSMLWYQANSNGLKWVLTQKVSQRAWFLWFLWFF